MRREDKIIIRGANDNRLEGKVGYVRSYTLAGLFYVELLDTKMQVLCFPSEIEPYKEKNIGLMTRL